MKQNEKTACKQPVCFGANSQAFDSKCDSVLLPSAVEVGGFIGMPGRKEGVTPDEHFKGQTVRKAPTRLYIFAQNFAPVLGSLALSFYSHQQITMETID